jgi:hypothetical protein
MGLRPLYSLPILRGGHGNGVKNDNKTMFYKVIYTHINIPKKKERLIYALNYTNMI